MRRERACRTTDEAPAEPPLVVDVDGSLIGGDLLIEGIAQLPSVSPLSLFALPFRLAATMVRRLIELRFPTSSRVQFTDPVTVTRASMQKPPSPGNSIFVTLLRGRAGLKRRIAEAVPLPPDTLAWNPAVLEEIAVAQVAGRSVWLASASDTRAVSPLAETVEGGGLPRLGRAHQPGGRGQGGRSGRALRRARVRLYRQRAARSGGLETGAARLRVGPRPAQRRRGTSGSGRGSVLGGSEASRSSPDDARSGPLQVHVSLEKAKKGKG